jgi:hypothetical protein
MKQLKILFKDSQQALEFCDHARTSGLYLWDCDSLEREIILNYSKSLPQTLKNTKSWYYDTDVEDDFNRWIEYMTLAGYALEIKMITKPSLRFPPKGI